MNIYLVKRIDPVDYDEYDSMVIIAKSYTVAREVHPGGHYIWNRADKVWRNPNRDEGQYSSWVSDPELLVIELLGESKHEPTDHRIVLASFRAG